MRQGQNCIYITLNHGEYTEDNHEFNPVTNLIAIAISTGSRTNSACSQEFYAPLGCAPPEGNLFKLLRIKVEKLRIIATSSAHRSGWLT